jgi:hypothetical protein
MEGSEPLTLIPSLRKSLLFHEESGEESRSPNASVVRESNRGLHAAGNAASARVATQNTFLGSQQAEEQLVGSGAVWVKRPERDHDNLSRLRMVAGNPTG